MSLTARTMTYECKAQMPYPNRGHVQLGQFPSEVDNNGEISVLIETKQRSQRRQTSGCGPGARLIMKNILDIQVKKSTKNPVRVYMKLEICHSHAGAEEVIKSVEDWKTSCYFHNWILWGMPNDRLNIVLEITWITPNMSAKVSNYLMNETFSDVSIVIGDEKLFAHKLILGAASPVILGMVTSPMKEAAENCIEIEDIEADVMKAILKLLYTGQDTDFGNSDLALKALVAAEKYDMKEMKELCERKLLANLSTANALEFLDVADTHKAENLAKKSLAFIAKHKKEIVRTDNFKEICARKPLLVMDFINSIVDDAAPDSDSD